MPAEQLFARFDGGQDIPIIGGNIEYTFDAVSVFSFTILARDIDWFQLVNREVEIHKNGQVIKTGYVFKRPQLEIDNRKALMIKVDCEDYLGQLICYRPRPNAQYTFQTFADVLDDLLLAANGDWVWVDVNAVVAEVNLDLRTKENLFGQIVELVQSVPFQHLRYGGVNGLGQHILEIGYFMFPSLNISKSGNLLSLKQSPNFNRCYSEIQPYAEMGGIDTPITLEGVMDLPEYATNPNIIDFPIVLLGDGSYVVQNAERINDPQCNCSLKRNFSVISPRSSGSRPTILERIYAGYALYLKSVRHLLNADDYDMYTAEVITPEIPIVGDELSVYGVMIEEPVFNGVGDTVTYVETFELSGEFRIHSVSYDLAQLQNPEHHDCHDCGDLTNQFLVSITFSTRDDLLDFDPQLYLYERLEQLGHFNYIDQGCNSNIQYVSGEFDNTVTPTCSTGGPFNGFEINVPVPTCRPDTATNVTAGVILYLFGFPGHIATLHSLIQPVDLSGSATFCVGVDNGDFDITALPSGANVSWDVQFIFT